ncbi:MAG: DUF4251 domain-containing protein [Chitinophagaceae bacterium]|nr:DUF4251 domain-containing protein [Chitinophagaceae bacterium]
MQLVITFCFKRVLLYACRAALLALVPAMAWGQTKAEEKARAQAAVKEQIEAKSFKVKVTQASTQRGRTINLTSDYFIEMKADTARCDLPFFGRAFAGSPYGGEGGIQLSTTDFEYELAPRKKGGWAITIRPRSDRDVRIINLYIGPDGYCTANFTFNSRSPMSYFGSIATR